MPRLAPSSNDAASGPAATAWRAGSTMCSAAVPSRRRQAASQIHTRSPTSAGSTPSPTASMMPAPSWFGTCSVERPGRSRPPGGPSSRWGSRPRRGPGPAPRPARARAPAGRSRTGPLVLRSWCGRSLSRRHLRRLTAGDRRSGGEDGGVTAAAAIDRVRAAHHWAILPSGSAAAVGDHVDRLVATGARGLVVPQIFAPPWATLGAAATACELDLASGIALGVRAQPDGDRDGRPRPRPAVRRSLHARTRQQHAGRQRGPLRRRRTTSRSSRLRELDRARPSDGHRRRAVGSIGRFDGRVLARRPHGPAPAAAGSADASRSTWRRYGRR